MANATTCCDHTNNRLSNTAHGLGVYRRQDEETSFRISCMCVQLPDDESRPSPAREVHFRLKNGRDVSAKHCRNDKKERDFLNRCLSLIHPGGLRPTLPFSFVGSLPSSLHHHTNDICEDQDQSFRTTPNGVFQRNLYQDRVDDPLAPSLKDIAIQRNQVHATALNISENSRCSLPLVLLHLAKHNAKTILHTSRNFVQPAFSWMLLTQKDHI